MEAMKGTTPLGKLKSMISIVYSMFLWMTKALPSSMQALKLAFPFHDHHLSKLNLRTLLSSTARSAIIYSYIVPPPPPLPPPPPPPQPSSASSSSSLSSLLCKASSTSLTWSLSTTGDLLGTESGVHMSSNEEILQEELKHKRTELLYLTSCTTIAAQRKQEKADRGAKKEYPPTISCLARVLTREYVDGRLILREERGKNLGCMEAERENGRLRLNLVPLYDDIIDEEEDEDEEEPEFIDQEEDGKSIDENFEAENEEEKSDGDDGIEEGIEEEEEVILTKIKKEGDNCVRRCFTNYGNRIPAGSCFFELPIPVKSV